MEASNYVELRKRTCPYDENHVVSEDRMGFHIVKCRNRYEKLNNVVEEKRECPYQCLKGQWIVSKEYQYHIKYCRQKDRKVGDAIPKPKMPLYANLDLKSDVAQSDANDEDDWVAEPASWPSPAVGSRMRPNVDADDTNSCVESSLKLVQLEDTIVNDTKSTTESVKNPSEYGATFTEETVQNDCIDYILLSGDECDENDDRSCYYSAKEGSVSEVESEFEFEDASSTVLEEAMSMLSLG